MLIMAIQNAYKIVLLTVGNQQTDIVVLFFHA